MVVQILDYHYTPHKREGLSKNMNKYPLTLYS